MAFRMFQILLLVTMATMGYSTYTLGRTGWGHPGRMDSCNPDTVINGFRLKVESYRGIFKDDYALTGIQFHCTDGKVLTSAQYGRGSWRAWHYCPQYATVSGVNYNSQSNQGVMRDDSAGNNMNLQCIEESGRASWIYGDGLDFGGWDVAYCPVGQRVCSLQTKVDSRSGSGDDTAVNKIKFNCCELPQLK